MKFYRLEKTNYFKLWTVEIIRAIALSLLATIAIMIVTGYKFMIVSSGSMEPTLPVGSLVIVTPVKMEDLQLGDIVTMHTNAGVNLTHRIVGKMDINNNIVSPEDEGYDSAVWYTKGDASNSIDGRITNKEIVGVVRPEHCFTFVGLIVRYIRSNYMMLIIMLVIFVAFVEMLNYLKSKLVIEDIECYEIEDDEE